MIENFGDEQTRLLFETGSSRRFGTVQQRALIKLGLLDAASALSELRNPPGNRLEALRGDRMGQHSIRINDQYRICFVWRENRAWDVEIVDYH